MDRGNYMCVISSFDELALPEWCLPDITRYHYFTGKPELVSMVFTCVDWSRASVMVSSSAGKHAKNESRREVQRSVHLLKAVIIVWRNYKRIYFCSVPFHFSISLTGFGFCLRVIDGNGIVSMVCLSRNTRGKQINAELGRPRSSSSSSSSSSYNLLTGSSIMSEPQLQIVENIRRTFRQPESIFRLLAITLIRWL